MGITRQDLAQDRAFWRDLLAQRTSLRGLPAHSAGGYRNRRFAIIRDAAWITLYRVTLPFPQLGVFLRCAGLAGEAFSTLADRARPEIEPLLRSELGPDLAIEWGASHHPRMTDIAAILAAPLPWNDSAAEQHIAWMLRVGAAWWNRFASLAGTPEVTCHCKGRVRRAARLSHEADQRNTWAGLHFQNTPPLLKQHVADPCRLHHVRLHPPSRLVDAPREHCHGNRVWHPGDRRTTVRA